MSGFLWTVFETVVQSRGAAPAIIHGDARISFDDLRRLALETAATAAMRGVGAGDRCLIYAGNSIQTAAALLAAWRLDAIVVLVSEEAPLSHLDHAQAVCEPRLAIASASLAQQAAAALACPIMVLEERAPSAQAWRETLRRSDTLASAPASIFFTSGSTGRPKGVTQSHATLLAGCRAVAAHLGLNPSDSILCPVPWAFDYGYGQLLSTVLLGITQILITERGPDSFLQAVEQHRPTILAGLPTIYALLLRGLSSIREADLSSFRLITSTGGAIPEAIFDDMKSVFGHCDISLNYGMTETYRTAGLPFALARELPKSVGFGYPGVSVAVVRENNEQTEPDEVGEIVHRGVGTFMGYWGEPEATQRVLRPDPLWMHAGVPGPKVVFTGDLGWKDKEGRLFIKGRRDRMIKSMGYRVSLDEIEIALREAGIVRELVVVSVPHEILGETLVAVVRREDGAPDPVAKLRAYARSYLARYMQPQHYSLVDEFPLTQNRKIDLVRLTSEQALRIDPPKAASRKGRPINRLIASPCTLKLGLQILGFMGATAC